MPSKTRPRRSAAHFLFVQIPQTTHTRCGPYFGTTVEAVQCLTYQTEWNIRICKKETKHTLFGGGRGAGERVSLGCRQVTRKVPKTVKNLFLLQFRSWDGSFRHGEMKISICLYFQHVTRYIVSDFVEEYISNSANNAFHGRCSSPGVLHEIPSNYTCSVRRQILLWFWALSGGIDLLP